MRDSFYDNLVIRKYVSSNWICKITRKYKPEFFIYRDGKNANKSPVMNLQNLKLYLKHFIIERFLYSPNKIVMPLDNKSVWF